MLRLLEIIQRITPEQRILHITEGRFLLTIEEHLHLTTTELALRLTTIGQLLLVGLIAHSVRLADPVLEEALVLRAEAQEDLPAVASVDPEEEGEINFPFFFEIIQHKKA